MYVCTLGGQAPFSIDDGHDTAVPTEKIISRYAMPLTEEQIFPAPRALLPDEPACLGGRLGERLGARGWGLHAPTQGGHRYRGENGLFLET